MRLIDTTARRLAVLGRPYRIGDGILLPDETWARMNLVYVPMPAPLPLSWDLQTTARVVRCHRLLAHQLLAIFDDLYEGGMWQAYFRTYGGSYVVRRQRGSTAISVHTFAGAVDFNTDTMPQGSRERWPTQVAKIWNAHGWINGAGFPRPDPQHWEARKIFP